MKFKTLPGYVINRGGERLIADKNGIINTENMEAIEALTHLFGKVETKKVETESIKKAFGLFLLILFLIII